MEHYLTIEKIANDHYDTSIKSDTFLRSFITKNEMKESYLNNIKEDLEKVSPIIAGINTCFNKFQSKQTIEHFKFISSDNERFMLTINDNLTFAAYKLFPRTIIEPENLKDCSFFLNNNNHKDQVQFYIHNVMTDTQERNLVKEFVNKKLELPKDIMRNMKKVLIDFNIVFEAFNFSSLNRKNDDSLVRILLGKDILSISDEEIDLLKLEHDVDLKVPILKIQNAFINLEETKKMKFK